MPSADTVKIEPDDKIPISVGAVVAGSSEREIHRLIDDDFLPATTWVEVGSHRELRAVATPLASFGVSGHGTMLNRVRRREAMRMIEGFVRKNWRRLGKESGYARRHRLEGEGFAICLGEAVSEAMERLNTLQDARHRIVYAKDIRGGIHVIRGTRISPYEVTGFLVADGMENTLKHHPTLTREDVEIAKFYAKVYPLPYRRQSNEPLFADPKYLIREGTVSLK